MKKFIRIALSLITIVIAAACTKNPGSDKNEDYKRTTLFVMEEPVLEGDEIVITSILTDAESTPVADKNIRIVIRNVRTVSGVTDRNGQAIIRTEPISAGTYSCRAFLMEMTNIILHITISSFRLTKETNRQLRRILSRPPESTWLDLRSFDFSHILTAQIGNDDSVGFIYFVYFFSLGYAFSITGMALATMILFRGDMEIWGMAFCILLMIYGLRLGIYLLVRESRSASYRKILRPETDSNAAKHGLRSKVMPSPSSSR